MYFVFPAVNLEKRDGSLAVDLVSWRVSKVALGLEQRERQQEGS